MPMDKLQMFFQLTKVDPIKGIVEGIAVQEVPDKSGEIFDYSTSKANFESWSGAISKATDGENLGNVREMHGKTAVGKLTAITFDDDQKLIRVTAKIVDDGAKHKLAEKIYTGFSIGGKYGKKWTDPDNKELTRYTAVPSELSLVDNPCVPGATFTMVKADGTEESVPFALNNDPLSDNSRLELARAVSAGLEDAELVNTVAAYADHPLIKALGKGADRDTVEEVLLKIAARDDVEPAEGTSKYGNVTFADEKNKKYPIDTEAHIRAAWNYINKEKNASKYEGGDLKTLKSKIVAAWKKHIDKAGPPSAEKADAEPGLQKDVTAPASAPTTTGDPAGAAAAGLKKSMSQVSSLANIIDSLCYLRDSVSYEAGREMDGSPLPTQIETLISGACELLRDLADEETEEIEDGHEYFAMAAHVGSLRKIVEGQVPKLPAGILTKSADKLKALLEKYGARHSKVDQGHLQEAHDHLSAMGAVCTTGEEEDGEKLLQGTDLQKALQAKDQLLAKVTNERDALQLKLSSIPKPGKAAALAFTLTTKGDTGEPSAEDMAKLVDARVAEILALPEDKRMAEINRLGILAQAGKFLQ